MATAGLIIDAPLPGPANMARDEALLRACADPDTPPVVRFYAWSTPTLSIGYFQAFSEYKTLDAPAGDLPVVRRTTGGGAILHDLELTYSIVMPLRHPLIRTRPNHLYNLAHQAIINAVGHGTRLFGEGRQAYGESSRRGPFFCFARRHPFDICIPDETAPHGLAKIAGSSQRRTARAVLQHGSIILDSRFPQQPCAGWCRFDNVAFDTAAQRLAPQFERVLEFKLSRTQWKPETLNAAREYESRYAGDAWTIERRRTD